jgi:beta-lactam-binding protein with PASTA domain
MTVGAAQTLATSVGLGTVNQIGTTETGDIGLHGTIASQDPAVGISVAVGTNVDVIIYVPPAAP